MLYMNWEINMAYTGKERRKNLRIKFPCELTLTLHKENRNIPARLDNISVSGAGISLKQMIPANSKVELVIYAVKETPISCVGKVIWVKEKNTECSKSSESFAFFAGIQFSRISAQGKILIKNLILVATTP